MRRPKHRKTLAEQYIAEETIPSIDNTSSFDYGIYSLEITRETLPVTYRPIRVNSPLGDTANHKVRVRKLEAWVRFERHYVEVGEAETSIAANGKFLEQYGGECITVAIVRLPGRSQTFGGIPSRELLWDRLNYHTGDCAWCTNPTYADRMQILAIQSITIPAAEKRPIWVSSTAFESNDLVVEDAYTIPAWIRPAFTTIEKNGGVATGITVDYPAITIPAITIPQHNHNHKRNNYRQPQTTDAVPDPIYLSVECDYLEDIDLIDDANRAFVNNDYMALICGTWTSTPAAGFMPPRFVAHCQFRLCQEPQ